MSDADLILRFRAGQHQAFNTLVWRWQGCLYRFALRYSGDAEVADPTHPAATWVSEATVRSDVLARRLQRWHIIPPKEPCRA